MFYSTPIGNNGLLNGTLNGPLNNTTTTPVGVAFTNQPANDGVEVLSSNAGDTTQTVTIIGTTNGSDTVVVETVSLNGTTVVSTVKTNWGVILAVKKSAATLGTVTVREASGDATITAGLTAAVLSVGVTAVTLTTYNRVVSLVASGATTKQLGLQGINSSGATIYDSQALTGATTAVSNSTFFTVTEIYTGDLEVTRTATVTADGTLFISAGLVSVGDFVCTTFRLNTAPSVAVAASTHKVAVNINGSVYYILLSNV